MFAGTVELSQELAPRLRRLIKLNKIEGDGPPGLFGESPHPLDLFGHVRVIRRHLKDAMAGATKRLANRKKLHLIGEGAGDVFTVGAFVNQCARRRESERPSANSVLDQSRHRLDVGCCRWLVACSALFHDIGSYRARRAALVRRCRSPAALIRGRRDTAETSPNPRDPLTHRRSGDVLDSLHQLNEPLASLWLDRRKPNSAVPHHNGRNPMTT